MGSYGRGSSLKMENKDKKPTFTRTAMGEYIVPPGGKPLTSLVDSTPGPSEYFPNIDSSKYVAPQYSLAGPYRKDKVKYPAGPADHDVRKETTWSRKVIHVKGKGTTRPYDLRDKAHLNDSIGPGRYHIVKDRNSLVWEQSPKWTLKSKHREGINAGHPNGHIHPVDTHRHSIPAANKYGPVQKYNRYEHKGNGPEYSFRGPYREIKPEGPGPGDYDARVDTDTTIGKVLKGKLPAVWDQQKDVRALGPGPAEYMLPTDMGTGLKKIIGELPPVVEWDPAAPPPNIYTMPELMGRNTAAHSAIVNWRPFSPDIKPQPGPAEYVPADSISKSAPSYSFGGPTKPVYPDVMHYPKIAERISGENPGPGHYEQMTGTLTKNSSPKFSMGKRAKSGKSVMPAPNKYNIQKPEPPNVVKAPSYSFGSRSKKSETGDKIGPGPAAYFPQLPKSGIAFTMLRRPIDKQVMLSPGPKYKLQGGQTCKGIQSGAVTFKGRPSPFLYNGRKGNRLLEAQ